MITNGRRRLGPAVDMRKRQENEQESRQDGLHGAETVGEKTKQAAETVGEKTKEMAETVGKKTKKTIETVGEKTTEGTRTAHRKSQKTMRKTKAQAGEERSSNREPNTPSPTDH